MEGLPTPGEAPNGGTGQGRERADGRKEGEDRRKDSKDKGKEGFGQALDRINTKFRQNFLREDARKGIKVEGGEIDNENKRTVVKSLASITPLDSKDRAFV